MGNRGILHDDSKRLVRYAQLRRWIACVLEFRGRKRVVMSPHRYTELFFLDEATSLAAGHRPCAECRREDYRRFCELWSKCHGEPLSADIIDRQLERERLASPRTKRVYQAKLFDLPDGAFIAESDRPWLLWRKKLFAWSAAAYTESRALAANRMVDVLTPRSSVALLAAGYAVAVHPTADAD